MNAEAPQPLLFSAWLDAVTVKLNAAKLGAHAELAPDFNPLFVEKILTSDPGWCAPAKDCAALVSSALDAALDQAAALQGADMTQWRWGTAHQATFANPIFSHVPVLNRIFDRAIADNGGIDTVHAGAYNGIDPKAPFTDVHGPGLRAVYDLADLDRSVFMIGPGQSEDMLSAHYSDLLTPWQRGDWLALPEHAEGEVLRLEP